MAGEAAAGGTCWTAQNDQKITQSSERRNLDSSPALQHVYAFYVTNPLE